jgi:hypothetical protein
MRPKSPRASGAENSKGGEQVARTPAGECQANGKSRQPRKEETQRAKVSARSKIIKLSLGSNPQSLSDI